MSGIKGVIMVEKRFKNERFERMKVYFLNYDYA